MDNENEEPRSLSDDLSAAWDASEDTTNDETETTENAGEGGEVSGQDAAADLRTGDIEPAEGDESDQGDADGGDLDAGGVPGGEVEDPGAAVGDEGAGAPVSWNATARETWKDIPKEAQAYIVQREQEFEKGIQQYAQNAQRAQAMDQVLQPYGQYFAMNGGPGETIKQLLATGAGLQMGSPVQKAQMVAQLITNFGVDINTLDNLLVGKQPDPGTQQTSEVQQAVAAAMQPFQTFMQGQQQQVINTQQQTEQQAGSEVDQFANDPKNEFYRDVSNDMADILEMASKRNLPMSLKDAYDRACQLNPEVSGIMANRNAAVAAGRKRNASVSISGSPGGEGNYDPPSDMRGAIEAAWDTAGQQQ